MGDSRSVIVRVGDRQEVKLQVGSISSAPLPLYNGPWNVTPLVNASTILATRQKSLDRNVVIEAIPYAEVSNIKGGLTATIGG